MSHSASHALITGLIACLDMADGHGAEVMSITLRMFQYKPTKNICHFHCSKQRKKMANLNYIPLMALADALCYYQNCSVVFSCIIVV